MKKDIEWLKEEVKKILRDKVSDGINYYDYMDLKRSLNDLIDQLDEPEILSQEWTDEHPKAVTYDGMNTTELIELLKSVEFGTSGRPREISIRFDSEGMFFPNPEFNITSTGDGIAGAELTLELTGEVWMEVAE